MGNRNKPFTDAELNEILPTAGYEIVRPPDGYVEKNIESLPSTELVGNDEMSSNGGYHIPVATEALKN